MRWLRSQTVPVLHNVAANLIAAPILVLAPAAVVVMWGWSEELPKSLLLVMFVAMLAYGLTIASKVTEWRSKRPRWRTDEELGNQLHAWLRTAHYQLQDIPEPGASFAFIATEPTVGRPVTISKYPNNPNIQMRMQIILRPETRRIVATMNEGQFAALREDVALELARMGHGHDLRDIINQGIVIFYVFPVDDAMTQWQFGQGMKHSERGNVIADAVLSRHVRQARERMGMTSPSDRESTPQPAEGES